MPTFRKHRKLPYTIVVVHGGPGGAGEMAPVAAHLSKTYGVLEPLQTKLSFRDQVEELKEVLEAHAQLPVILIGYSYGSFLSFALAGLYPRWVKKLILLSSGVFEESYAADIMATRLQRMSPEERATEEALMKQLGDPQQKNKDAIFFQLAELSSRVDSYDPLPFDTKHVEVSYEIYDKVWKDTQPLRADGTLLSYGRTIQCPVVTIHGDYDPHPAEGIQVPLARTLKDFRFILLEKCGHHPWFERHAKDEFYRVLGGEIKSS
jgi:pimeloyl-ACP methyl ester carboxylesterase